MAPDPPRVLVAERSIEVSSKAASDRGGSVIEIEDEEGEGVDTKAKTIRRLRVRILTSTR